MIKKIISAALCLALAVCLLAGCGESEPSPGASSGETKLSIVATIFPEYDWVREILGDKAEDVELTLLLDSGVDMHSFQPSVDDVVKISNCDLFIYVGGESDAWVTEALSGSGKDGREIINLLDVLSERVVEEELAPGMQAEEEEEEEAYDEHVWLSLGNAAVICRSIAEKLRQLDPENGETYAENAENYLKKLAAMDVAYWKAVEGAGVKTLVFGDRFPFRYMTEDYGLEYYAAFPGCSAETEASFETVVFLANKIDKLSLPAVLTIETSDGKLAQTIIDNTETKSAQVLTLDSIQSTTAQEISAGETYLGIMEKNLEVLKTALG